MDFSEIVGMRPFPGKNWRRCAPASRPPVHPCQLVKRGTFNTTSGCR